MKKTNCSLKMRHSITSNFSFPFFTIFFIQDSKSWKEWKRSNSHFYEVLIYWVKGKLFSLKSFSGFVSVPIDSLPSRKFRVAHKFIRGDRKVSNAEEKQRLHSQKLWARVLNLTGHLNNKWKFEHKSLAERYKNNELPSPFTDLLIPNEACCLKGNDLLLYCGKKEFVCP